MQNTRRLQRRHLIYYLRVVDSETDQLIGFLVDITTAGLMVMSEEPLEVGRVFRCKMLVQSEMSDREHLCFEAKSLWCRKAAEASFYDTGMQLLSMAPENLAGIQQIIDELGFND